MNSNYGQIQAKMEEMSEINMEMTMKIWGFHPKYENHDPYNKMRLKQMNDEFDVKNEGEIPNTTFEVKCEKQNLIMIDWVLKIMPQV